MIFILERALPRVGLLEDNCGDLLFAVIYVRTAY